MLLKDLLYNVPLKAVSGSTDVDIRDLVFDSRKVQHHTLFVAIRGTQLDGHSFIHKAVTNGVAAVVCESIPEKTNGDVTYVEVADSSHALGIMASNFYGHPSKSMRMIGITGTNGKTSIAMLLTDLFSALGYTIGLISTVENRVAEEIIPSTHTTPDALVVNQLLRKMINKGCTHCFMEVSSHAIDQNRIDGIEFSGVVFTNLTHDHLDYHGSFENYIKAKKKLFDGLSKRSFSLVNKDDKNGQVMEQNTMASRNTYSLRGPAQFRAKIISESMDGLELDIDGKQVWFRLIGKFNAYNLLATYGTAVLLNEDPDEVLVRLSELEGPPGRLEQITNEQGITAIVDYAHTPDALKKVLETIDNIRGGNEVLITVIGCGGDRDKKKRPLMASIASSMSDKVVLTSDNPRTENPMTILNEMEAGVSASKKRNVLVIEDRGEAIKTACMLAQKGDIILVAGKGHETYQEINGVRSPFDDRKVLKSILNLTEN